tara:strand:+ start:80 stop:538 length:459 start_codon:yes stop_codon:yes gene_type:complete
MDNFLDTNHALHLDKCKSMHRFAVMADFKPIAHEDARADNDCTCDGGGFFQLSYKPSTINAGVPVVRISSASPAGLSWADNFNMGERSFLYLLPAHGGAPVQAAIDDLLNVRGRPVKVVLKAGNPEYFYSSTNFITDPEYNGGNAVRIIKVD